jgi:hypothetical protein
MSKIMILTVAGVEEPYKRLVSVDNEDEFVGTMLASSIKDILGTMPLETTLTRETLIIEAIRNIKIDLKDTGLKEYPESNEEIEAVLERGGAGMKNRVAEIRMLHAGLGSKFWHWRDILYVLTGKVL